MITIFDSHPVQYKAPVYRCLESIKPRSFRVIYMSDCSVRGHEDRGFGTRITWDVPLLEGYDYRVLNNERGVPLRGFRSLTGRGIFQMLKTERPKAVILSQFIYEADIVTYLSCLLLGIPIWIRQETQDEAFRRSWGKSLLRDLVYRLAYRGVGHAFYFGQLNREHLLRLGIPESRMSFSPYCVANPLEGMLPENKEALREEMRKELGVLPGETVLLFSGKLIEKKNPQLILEALEKMPESERKHYRVVYIGSGELAESLRQMSEPLGDRVHFAGFVNQSRISAYYLAADVLILPSRRAGETWGLVVNEALHAGCAVAMSDAVGCHREFGTWERVRVFPEGDADVCARAVMELRSYPRSLDWCEQGMKAYGVHAAAEAIARQFDRVE